MKPPSKSSRRFTNEKKNGYYKPVIPSSTFVGAELTPDSIAARYWSFFTNQWVIATALAILIIGGIVVVVFYALQIVWFAPASNNILLSTDLSATCLSDNVDKGKQLLKLTYYNTGWCTNQCISYAPGFRAWDTSSKFPCPGVLSGQLGVYNMPYSGLLYSGLTAGSPIQDLTRSFTVAFWLALPTYQSWQFTGLGIICGMNNPTIPAFGQNTPFVQGPLVKWAIRAAPGKNQERVLYWELNHGDNQFRASQSSIALTGYISTHVIFQWDSVNTIGILYLNGGSATKFTPSAGAVTTYLTSPQVTYFSVGCGAPVIGLISKLQIIDGLPTAASLYDSTQGCTTSTNVDVPLSRDKLTCPAPDSYSLLATDGLTGAVGSSSAGSSSSSSSTTIGLSSSSSTYTPVTYQVCGNSWSFGTTCPNINAHVGDVLFFNSASPHTVYQMASAAAAYPTCSFLGATALSTNFQPYSYTVPSNAVGTSVFFACNVSNHCASGGLHLNLTVS